MDEMRKIVRVTKPDLVIFVGDSLAGNSVVEQAKQFNEAVRIDGVVLTKLDADARGGGGAALSISHAIGAPILFVGVGQGYDDLRPFDERWFADRIFGGRVIHPRHRRNRRVNPPYFTLFKSNRPRKGSFSVSSQRIDNVPPSSHLRISATSPPKSTLAVMSMLTGVTLTFRSTFNA